MMGFSEVDQCKNLERFVNQLNIVSTKILKDYNLHISEILTQWKQKNSDDSDKEDKNSDDSVSSDSSSKKKK